MTGPGAGSGADVTSFPGGHPGTLSTASGQQVAVRAYEQADDAVMLVLSPDASTKLAVNEAAELRYTCARGIVRLAGRARHAERDLVRFEPRAEPDVDQRRDFVRVAATETVTLTRGFAPAVRAQAVDLSGGGIRLTGVGDLPPDACVGFSLTLSPGHPPITGTGRVVRRAGEDCSLMFETIAEEDRQRLITYVFDRLRAARARTPDSRR